MSALLAEPTQVALSMSLHSLPHVPLGIGPSRPDSPGSNLTVSQLANSPTLTVSSGISSTALPTRSISSHRSSTQTISQGLDTSSSIPTIQGLPKVPGSTESENTINSGVASGLKIQPAASLSQVSSTNWSLLPGITAAPSSPSSSISHLSANPTSTISTVITSISRPVSTLVLPTPTPSHHISVTFATVGGGIGLIVIFIFVGLFLWRHYKSIHHPKPADLGERKWHFLLAWLRDKVFRMRNRAELPIAFQVPTTRTRPNTPQGPIVMGEKQNIAADLPFVAAQPTVAPPYVDPNFVPLPSRGESLPSRDVDLIATRMIEFLRKGGGGTRLAEPRFSSVPDAQPCSEMNPSVQITQSPWMNSSQWEISIPSDTLPLYEE